jgi:hypothetical protein
VTSLKGKLSALAVSAKLLLDEYNGLLVPTGKKAVVVDFNDEVSLDLALHKLLNIATREGLAKEIPLSGFVLNKKLRREIAKILLLMDDFDLDIIQNRPAGDLPEDSVTEDTEST